MLSHAGREVLIKSTLSTLSFYYMSTVKLPNNIIKKMTDIIRDFWWGFDSHASHLYLKSWNSFQYHKKYGGLGFKNLYFMNWALLMKQSWALI